MFWFRGDIRAAKGVCGSLPASIGTGVVNGEPFSHGACRASSLTRDGGCVCILCGCTVREKCVFMVGMAVATPLIPRAGPSLSLHAPPAGWILEMPPVFASIVPYPANLPLVYISTISFRVYEGNDVGRASSFLNNGTRTRFTFKSILLLSCLLIYCPLHSITFADYHQIMKMVRLLAVLVVAGTACVSAFMPVLPATRVLQQQGKNGGRCHQAT